jgi:hypothetical protein
LISRVNKNQSEHHTDEPQLHKRRRVWPARADDYRKKERCDKFYDRIDGRNASLTATAPAAKKQITDDGNIVPGSNALTAGRTGRAGANNRLAPGNSMDDDIEKASNDKSEYKTQTGNKPWRKSRKHVG